MLPAQMAQFFGHAMMYINYISCRCRSNNNPANQNIHSNCACRFIIESHSDARRRVSFNSHVHNDIIQAGSHNAQDKGVICTQRPNRLRMMHAHIIHIRHLRCRLRIRGGHLRRHIDGLGMRVHMFIKIDIQIRRGQLIGHISGGIRDRRLCLVVVVHLWRYGGP